MASDIKDILNAPSGRNNGKTLKEPELLKKPKNVSRESWRLMSFEEKTQALSAKDTGTGYVDKKAKLGSVKCKSWKWVPFQNPGRRDNAVFHHWSREDNLNDPYVFNKFNVENIIPTYSDIEYENHLVSKDWTRVATDHLFDLCRRYDQRFMLVHDRWEKDRYGERSVEDLKERYFSVFNTLEKLKADATGQSANLENFDKIRERDRKRMLACMHNRTNKEVDEEQALLTELKKIKKWRKKAMKKAKVKKVKGKKKVGKTCSKENKSATTSSTCNEKIKPPKSTKIRSSDGASTVCKRNTGKGIAGGGTTLTCIASSSSTGACAALTGDTAAGIVARSSTFYRLKKRLKALNFKKANILAEERRCLISPASSGTTQIRFPQLKKQDVSLRSRMIQFPELLTKKKVTAVQEYLEELGIDTHAVVTEKIVDNFRSLCQEICVLTDLKSKLRKLETEENRLNQELVKLSPCTSSDDSIISV